jgi:hypothetical protein
MKRELPLLKLLFVVFIAVFLCSACDDDDSNDDLIKEPQMSELAKKQLKLVDLIFNDDPVITHSIDDSKMNYTVILNSFEGCFNKCTYEYNGEKILKIDTNCEDVYEFYWTENKLDSVLMKDNGGGSVKIRSKYLVGDDFSIISETIYKKYPKELYGVYTFKYNQKGLIIEQNSENSKMNFKYFDNGKIKSLQGNNMYSPDEEQLIEFEYDNDKLIKVNNKASHYGGICTITYSDSKIVVDATNQDPYEYTLQFDEIKEEE